MQLVTRYAQINLSLSVLNLSAGVGRTGSFLAIYDLLVKGHQGLDLSVPETVNNLRKQRMKMVEKQVELSNEVYFHNEN